MPVFCVQAFCSSVPQTGHLLQLVEGQTEHQSQQAPTVAGQLTGLQHLKGPLKHIHPIISVIFKEYKYTVGEKCFL